MNSGTIVIGISIVIITMIIYIIKNLDKLKDTKIAKRILYLSIGLISVLAIFYIVFSIKDITKYISFYIETKKNNKFFEDFDIKIQEENDFYNEQMNKDYGEVQKEPYIPEGFRYLEGEWNNGFVIEDENQNQYVWVPCTNKDDENIVRLEKKDFYLYSAINYYNCLDIDYEEFIISTLENGGFYISRFELGIENEKIVSKKNAKILTGITRAEAIEKVNSLYTNTKCKLINGFAYDTTLSWIKKTNEITIQKYNTEENIVCGRNQYNNIYDFTDNVMELTLENLYDTIIYRGFDYSKDLELESRYNYVEEKNYCNIKTMKLIGFRTIIYK